MTAKKKTAKPQRSRFIETAKQLGYDKTGVSFERALTKIAPPKRKLSIADFLNRNIPPESFPKCPACSRHMKIRLSKSDRTPSFVCSDKTCPGSRPIDLLAFQAVAERLGFTDKPNTGRRNK